MGSRLSLRRTARAWSAAREQKEKAKTKMVLKAVDAIDEGGKAWKAL